MAKTRDELSQQSSALEKLSRFYFHGKGRDLLEHLPQGSMPFFAGMGVAADAAAIAAMQCQRSAVPALALETFEILSLPSALLSKYAPLVYLSVTGEDAEIPMFLRKVEQGPLIAITDVEESTLALSANLVLPMLAAEETPFTAKVYLNSLALLWLMCRRLGSTWDGREEELLNKAINRVHVLQMGKASILKAWQDVMTGVQRLIFTGQGSQALSARHGAAVMAGMARTPVQAVSLGNMQNGFIELSEPGMGVVIFASSEYGLSVELNLADELDGYGVKVVLVIDGMPRRIREAPPLPVGFDPFISTLLDAIAPQLWAIELSHALAGSAIKRPRINGWAKSS